MYNCEKIPRKSSDLFIIYLCLYEWRLADGWKSKRFYDTR